MATEVIEASLRVDPALVAYLEWNDANGKKFSRRLFPVFAAGYRARVAEQEPASANPGQDGGEREASLMAEQQHTCGTRQPPPCLACTIVGARQRFVQQWREDHPYAWWGEVWRCPLCNRAIQTDGEVSFDIARETHQREHGQVWLDYLNAGDALAGDDAARDGGG